MPDNFWSVLGVAVTTVSIAFFLTMIASLRRDKCLRAFNRFPSAVIFGSKIVYGTLKILHNGMTIEYKDTYRSNELDKTSYFVYDSEYSSIMAILRSSSYDSEKLTQIKNRQLMRMKNLGKARRIIRFTRNIANQIKDSILRSIDLILGAFMIRSKPVQLLSDAKSSVFQYISLAYEQMLENHVGKYVIVEMKNKDDNIELRGYLFDYTKSYILLMNEKSNIYFFSSSDINNENIQILSGDKYIFITNKSQVPLLVNSIESNGKSEIINMPILCGASLKIPYIENYKIKYAHTHGVDIIVPRSLAVIRHGSV